MSESLATAGESEALPMDALAEAPTEGEEGALPVDALGAPSAVAPEDAVAGEENVTPAESLAVVLTDDAATMLRRIQYGEDEIEILFATRAEHDTAMFVGDGDPDTRSIDPLTLGLLWKLEGGAKVTLDPADSRFATAIEDLAWIRDPGLGGALGAAWQSNAEHVWRITWSGIWGFGLDSIFGGSDTNDKFYDWNTARSRWFSNMKSMGWPTSNPPVGVRALPFEKADPSHTIESGMNVLNIDLDDAGGFLAAVAVRYTKSLWDLPAALEAVGIGFVEEHPLTVAGNDPLLAYLTYNADASRAAMLYAAVKFLQELCPAIIADTGGATAEEAGIAIQAETSLDMVVEVLDKWRTLRLDDSSKGFQYAMKQVVKSAVLPYSTREKLYWFFVPESAVYDVGIYTTAEALTEEERVELAVIISEWRSFSLLFAPYFSANPGEYMYTAANAAPPLVPADFGEFGYSVINFVGYATTEPKYRYLTATGKYPWE
jgi:hypothetical protein